MIWKPGRRKIVEQEGGGGEGEKKSRDGQTQEFVRGGWGLEKRKGFGEGNGKGKGTVKGKGFNGWEGKIT